MTAEHDRLREVREQYIRWKKFGPYLSERQWGTVREDYSPNENAWDYFTHDQARSRVYRWGEDGIAGICDDKQRLCFALALWNGVDPILKERLFGLTNSEGNHGEDVKEYYFYLDSTPTHSYMRYLYKYPQRAYPYEDLINTNRDRSRGEPEYELLDTGVFDDDRYFDVVVEYAKESPDDTAIRITVHNRGAEAADIHLLPTLWFRNTWRNAPEDVRPVVRRHISGRGWQVICASHPDLADYHLYCDGAPSLLFTENETNTERVFGQPNSTQYVKDAFHYYVLHGTTEAVNPEQRGTKAAAHYILTIPGGRSSVVKLRLCHYAPRAITKTYGPEGPFGPRYESLIAQRLEEADHFFSAITPIDATEDQARVIRQALAGMLWTKQYYNFDVDAWLAEHGVNAMVSGSPPLRNKEWFHMVNDDIISMPDKWEYPWYAAWDLAFHTIGLSTVDIDFAKDQLRLMTREVYLHPNGQIPAYEWNFSDVNPPVHAWALVFLNNLEKSATGTSDFDFLKSVFNKLMLNFTWWVNRKDRFGKNVFEGGFLGLDNIGIFDRSAPLPTGGFLEQADGTAWMALFCQNMLEIACDLAIDDPCYQDLALKFTEHFLWIAAALNRTGTDGDGLWDEEDGFYYDLLRHPDGNATRLKVRSMVGLLPVCAVSIIEKSQRNAVPNVVRRVRDRMARMPELTKNIHATGKGKLGVADRDILAVVNEERLRRILARMLDENEFLSPHGIRSMSRCHAEQPYTWHVNEEEFRVDYVPAESNSGMFGGNSNWRGPIWFPMNALLIRALIQYYLYYGDSFKIECPTGSGRWMTLYEVSEEIARRLSRIFLRDENGRRAVYGKTEKFQNDPHWRDHLLFYEYFHGDNGAGLGASHQTGWTGLVARIMQLYGGMDPESVLKGGRVAAFSKART